MGISVQKTFLGKSMMVKEKKILIAGCYGDFAKEIAQSLHKAGASLILAGKSKKKFLEKYKDSGIKGFEKLFFECDLSDEESVLDLEKKTNKLTKDLHGIVNCVAFPAYTKSIFETELAAWNEAFKVDVNSVFLVSKIFGKHLVDAGGGSIVNFTSFHIKATYPNRILYNACKSAVEGITRSMAVEVGKYNVRVNSIAPGPIYSSRTKFFLEQNPTVKTKMLARTPLNKIGTLGDVADLVLFLSSDYSKHITGQQLVIDGGWSVNAWFESFNT
ncbi:MAG: SDR family oxidoreductase [Bacteroidetes bacterium]|nr:MAG: SDR family oxidoreductase [Bacteroidota bacterium]